MNLADVGRHIARQNREIAALIEERDQFERSANFYAEACGAHQKHIDELLKACRPMSDTATDLLLQQGGTSDSDRAERVINRLISERDKAQESAGILEMAWHQLRDNILHDPDEENDTINWALGHIDALDVRDRQGMVLDIVGVLNEIATRGVTLPMEVEMSMSDDYLRGYARGVDSQRAIACDALDVLAKTIPESEVPVK